MPRIPSFQRLFAYLSFLDTDGRGILRKTRSRLCAAGMVEQHVSQHSLYLHDLTQLDWRECLEIVRSAGLKLRIPVWFGIDEPPEVAGEMWSRWYDWLDPEPDWIAAVLNGDQARAENLGDSINSPEEFATLLPPPCSSAGRLKPGVALRIDTKPKGQVFNIVDRRLILHDRIVKAGCLAEVGQLGAVWYRNSELVTWHTLDIHSRCAVLSNESLYPPGTCTACGTPRVSARGVWVARPGAEVTTSIAADELGLGHSGQALPIIVSPKMAMHLTKRLGKKSFGLEPVFAAESEVIRKMKEVEAEVSRVWPENKLIA